MAQGEPLGDVAADRAEVAQDALADRLERLEAVAGTGGVAAVDLLQFSGEALGQAAIFSNCAGLVKSSAEWRRMGL